MAKRYEELSFTDDFMFCKILELHPELCRELLELILGRSVGELALVNRQKPVEATPDGHGVRFDVYVKDGEKTIYDVEMQNANVDSIPKRSRYSQSMIDMDQFERGAKYSELCQSYVIFICRFNLFPKIGLHKYTFLNLCKEKPQVELGDGTEKIYLCAKGTAEDVSENMKAFLQFIATGNSESRFTEKLKSAVETAKYQNQWRRDYMNLLELNAIEREEGRKEGALHILCSLADEGILSIEEAAKRANMSAAEFQEKMTEEKE